MNNTPKRSTGRVIFLIIIALAGFFARRYARDQGKEFLSQQLPQQQTKFEQDYINQLSEQCGETVLVYAAREYENINGTPHFDKVIFFTGEENAFTGVGCAFFEKREINKQVGFMNIVSGYDTALDKTVFANAAHNDEAGFAVYGFDRMDYENHGFFESMFVTVDSSITKVELCIKNGETIICEESDLNGVYEIPPEYTYNLEKIYFYDAENNLLGQYGI